MGTQAGLALPLDDTVPPPLLEAVVRAVATALVPRQPPRPPDGHGGEGEDLPPLLSPLQAAKLMGVSRQTVDRMVAAGELPSIVLREGGRQRMVRIPKAFVLDLLRDLNAGSAIMLKDYTARWLATVAAAEGEGVPQPGIVGGAA